MRPLFVEDFAPSVATQVRREIIEELSKCDWEELRELHAQNAYMLRQKVNLEKEMRQQRTVADVEKVRRRANSVDPQVAQNNKTILDRLYAFFSRR